MYSLNILNINIISHILIHVSVISNNKKYEIKLLWEREQTTRAREQVGMERSNKILTWKKEAAGKGGCLLQVREMREQHVFSIYKRGKEWWVLCQEGWRNTLMCVLAPLCPCNTCALHPVPMLTKSGCATAAAAVATHYTKLLAQQLNATCQLPVESRPCLWRNANKNIPPQ